MPANHPNTNEFEATHYIKLHTLLRTLAFAHGQQSRDNSMNDHENETFKKNISNSNTIPGTLLKGRLISGQSAR